MKYRLLAAWAVLVLCAGCVHYSYDGVTAAPDAPDAEIAVFSDSAKISRPYTVLGTAQVSGNYLKVSRERLLKKLVSEAASCGASAVLITEQQVIPGEIQYNTPSFQTAYDFDTESSSWRQIYRDVDVRYGVVDGYKSDLGTTRSYTRVIRAEFLKYGAEE